MTQSNESKTSQYWVNAWYQGAKWLMLLWPLSRLYRSVMAIRHYFYKIGVFSVYKPPVPLIIVGNITVGGTGKTPLAIALVKYLQAAGYSPAMISRGYGSKAPYYPYDVDAQSDAVTVGDEPLMLFRSSACPVVIGPNRKAAIELLVKQHPDCNIIISDDGLQHYALARDIEIVVIDGQRLFGNRQCLPMGPLREPLTRLSTVDLVVYNTSEPHSGIDHTMGLTPQGLINLCGVVDQSAVLSGATVHAVAGIGNPQRFFATLRSQGYSVIEHIFDDHHAYSPEDLHFDDALPVIMTEKDAVKVMAFAEKHYWYLPVVAEISPGFFERLSQLLKQQSI